MLTNKIDFVGIITVKNANPNGDPLNGNRPRITDDGYGEISDVCLKRKIRNRLMEMGEPIFVQSDDNKVDEYKSLRERADANEALKSSESKEDFAAEATKSWIDVRAFGQVFAFKSKKKGEGVSVGIRGPVTIQSAFSVDPVMPESIQITKSVNTETGEKKGADTMGMKHRISFGVYLLKGSINVQLAEKTGFADEDAEKMRKAILTMFANDASSARPEGSMDLKQLYWFKHDSKLGKYSPATVHESVRLHLNDGVDVARQYSDYEVELIELDGLTPAVYEGYTYIQ